MKKIIALLLTVVLLLSGCTKVRSEATKENVTQTEPEETKEIVPEAAISIPCIYLRVAYVTDEGFVGLVMPEPGDHIREGKELNVVIEEGVEICVIEDDNTGSYIDAGEMTYEPGMLVEVQYTKWVGDTIYPELMHELDALWWEEENA